MPITHGGKPGIMNLRIPDKQALYSAYMPFIKNGGLFIATDSSQYQLGQEIFLLLSLMDDPEKLPVAATVVWKTPPRSQANRKPGIGVQFNEADRGQTRTKIETYLAGALQSDRPTHTM